MTKRINDPMQIMKYIFVILITGILLYFFLAECLLPSEDAMGNQDCKIFESEWEQVLPDGSRRAITVPGECEAYRKEAVIIETTLPEELEDGTSLCFRSSQQDMEIYVDGILRQRYCTKDSRPFGSNSMSAYVFASLNSGDSGKTLRVITVSDSTYSGYFNQVYIGDQTDIWSYFLSTYGPENLVAIGILLLSIICIAASALLRFCYHKDVVLNYLGWGVFLVALWIMAESKLRQFLLPNNSVFGSMAYFSLLLMPMPFLIYVDAIQENRYHKWYIAACGLSAVDFVVCTGLQLLGICNFLDSLPASHLVLVAVFILITVTIILDLKKKKVHDYFLIAIGALGIMITGCVEIIWVYQNSYQTRGTVICMGLVFLLAMACIKTGQDIMRMEKEKHLALMVSKSKADFLANMSHEIRTPINTIVGMNEMILRENQDADILEYAQSISRASNMLLTLIDDVLDFSKIEAGRLEVVESPYAVSSLLKDVVQVLESKAEKKGLQTEVKIDEQLPAILLGDEVRIKQIINNLLTNAVKYTPQGSVTFEVSGKYSNQDTYCIFVVVEDTGMGIRKEDMDRLFESFTRLEQRKNRSIEGTGLGLSITKRLVDLMDGEISVESVYGEGTKFTVMLPQKIVSEEAIEMAESDEKESFSEHVDAAGRLNVMDAVGMNEIGEAVRKETSVKQASSGLYAPNASILVVDDNDMNLAVVKALLKRTGIKLDLVSSGKECLEHCRKQKYDLILMDHMMPEMDGIETLHLLRAEKENPNVDTKVIVLTANAIVGSKNRYLEEGFTDYLSKPINAGKLEELLEKYLPVEALETAAVSEKKSESSIEPAAVEDAKEENNVLIDKESAMPYCCNSEDFFKEMLRVYQEQGEKYKKLLPEYFSQKDWENYAVIVHAIKSTSVTIGANTLSERAKQQEMAAKGKDETFLESNWEQFFEYYCSVLSCAAKMLE